MFLSHVVAQTGATPYRLYMKAVICEIIVSAEIGIVVEYRQKFNRHGYDQKKELNPLICYIAKDFF